MIPNIHQSIDEIIKAANPIQKIIWQQLRLLVGENAGVKQHFFAGPIVGSEFETYSANKLYFCLDFYGHNGSSGASNTIASLIFYNELNAILYTAKNTSVSYNSTTASQQYTVNQVHIQNFYFSRLTNATALTYGYIIFTGYRISY